MSSTTQYTLDQRVRWATIATVIVHLGGIWGMKFYDLALFASATPLNLLLGFALLLYTMPQRNKALFIFCVSVFCIGFLSELVGVHTAMLFGKYNYLPAMGLQIANVPVIIGINWVMVILCCGICMKQLSDKVMQQASKPLQIFYGKWGCIIDAAILACLYDFILEPVAVTLKLWQWATQSGLPELYNYICWFFVSLLCMLIFNRCQFTKHNNFAVNLLVIQVSFFIIIQIIL